MIKKMKTERIEAAIKEDINWALYEIEIEKN